MRKILFSMIFSFVAFILMGVTYTPNVSASAFVSTLSMNIYKFIPKPPEEAYKFSSFRTGVFEVAKVFGRAPGCEDADEDLINETNNAAVKVGLDPRIAAAVIAVESGCNQFAVSSRGAIGLMQISANTWKTKYNFAGNVNLLNRKDNIEVGTKILSGLIYQYGLQEGIHRYNGLGIGCETCDSMYTYKILSLSRRKS